MTIRVGVLGASGKMGDTVCRAVFAAADLELVAAIDPSADGSRSARGGVAYSDRIETLVEAGCEVAVDFTIAEAARTNLLFCAEHAIHAVCGTTGLSAADLAAFDRAFSPPERPNALIAANFAITAVLAEKMAELAAPFMDGVEIIELHHDQKRDAPSGSALSVARAIARRREESGAGAFSLDPTEHFEVDGVRGGKGPGGIVMHAVRLPGLVAHEEIHFGAMGQGLTIRQDSFDRTSFMPGVLLALRRVHELAGLTIGLDRLLGL